MSRNGWSMTKLCVLLATVLLVCLVLGAAPAFAAGTIRVDGDAAGCANSSGQGNPYGVVYCYIQDAVTDATAGDTIKVYPRAGVYDEGVDLSQMEQDGDITLITVNAAGVPTPGTVTVDNPGDDSEFYTGNGLVPFNGDVTIDGFVLRSEYGAIDLWVGSTDGAPAGAEGGLGPFLSRDVEIRNVDASHTGGDGITVRAEGNVTITDCTTNDNQGYGIGVLQAWGDVTITGCTSNENKGPGMTLAGDIACQAGGICVLGAQGQITIRNNTANGNDQQGIFVGPMYPDGQEAGLTSITTPDKVIIDKCTANNNDYEGIGVRDVSGDVTITDCTTNGNGEDGVLVSGRLIGSSLGVDLNGGDVTIKNCTSNGNEDSGFDPEDIEGTLSIQACIARNNEHGVDLDDMWEAESILVNGSIICGNECGIYLSGERPLRGDGGDINLEGNWWGCPGGPEAAGCDPICQRDSIPVDFTPWIAKITDSATVDPVSVGQPTEVSFQFSANPTAVYLGKGPGDLRGPAPFTVTTDNGKLDGNGSTLHKFLGAEGTLKVTLVPEHGGTATVWVDGPCGLDESIVLGVESEFVPEPATMLLLGSGLVGLAGYAGLQLRKR